jgi:CBS domain-containing protein
MSLETILATKGSEVVSIDFTTDLAAAAKLLTKHRIGALVVPGVDGASPVFCRSATSYALLRKAEVPFCSCRSRR